MALTKDFSIIASSSIINFMIGLVTTPIITRMAMPEDYGNWSLFNVVTNVVYMICLLGFDQVIVRYYYEQKDVVSKQRLLSTCWIYPVLFALIMIGPLIYFLDWKFLDWPIIMYALLGFNIIVSILNRISSILLRFTDKIKFLSFFTIIHKAIYVACAVLLLMKLENGSIALATGTVLSTSIVVVGAIFVNKKLWINSSISNKKQNLKEYCNYGFPLMIASSVYLIFQTIDKFVIKSYCNSEELGIYASAASLISLLAIVQTSFNTVWWPAVMKKYESNSQDKSFYVKANNSISSIMLLLGVLLIAFKDLIVFFLGPNFRAASAFIPFLMFQPIMYTISETTVLGLTFLKKSKVQLYISIISLLFNLAFCVLLTIFSGTQGTSIAVGLSYIVFFLLRTIWANKYYPIPFRLKRLYFCIFLLFMFAIYETYASNSVFTYIVATVLFMTISFLYREPITLIVHSLLNKIKNK